MAAKPVVLVGPDGREYRTTDRAEVTNLKARGYTVKVEKPKPAPKSDSK